MRDRTIFFLLSIAVVGLLCVIQYAVACNEMVCASIVSKCMLTQSCKCDLKNCSCCRECRQCLNYLYSECCSCVDMCPKPNDTRNALSKKSHVEDLEGITGLFSALTEEPDGDEKWRTFTFPVDFDSALYGNKLEKDIKYIMHSTDQELDAKVKERDNIVTLNCTVAYMSQCMSWNKCKESCQSMGANSYRWFHDGCCECVGDTCINYGINDSRCLYCPVALDGVSSDLEEDIPADQLEYGESYMDLNTADKY